jgi:hypothetical protein
VWLIILSDQLPVEALVGRYPANKLIGREAGPDRKSFFPRGCPLRKVSGISPGFPRLFRSPGWVLHVLLTRSPLTLRLYCYFLVSVRLACVRHAASVRPEPGSNSPSRTGSTPKDRTDSFERAQSKCSIRNIGLDNSSWLGSQEEVFRFPMSFYRHSASHRDAELT